MAFSLTEGNDKYMNEEFRVIIRSNYDYLIGQATSIPYLEDHIKFAFRYDFYRYLRYINIPEHMRWVIAFLNNVTNPFQDTFLIKEIKVIDERILEDIVSRANSIHQ